MLHIPIHVVNVAIFYQHVEFKVRHSTEKKGDSLL